MKQMILGTLLGALCAATTACAVITVNVYFPEKEVKEAYKSLDDMLLRQEPKPKEEPPEAKQGTTSRLLPAVGAFFIAEAHAAEESEADRLAVEISSDPQVLAAYDEMKARLPELDALRDSGAVGETRQGLVTVRDAAKLGGKKSVVDGENANRKTVITAMARAIIKITKQPEKNFNQVLGKAAAGYAATRREAARRGWWVQGEDGSWVQK